MMKYLFFILTALFVNVSFGEATNPPIGIEYPGNRDGSKADCCSGNSFGGTRYELPYNACHVTADCKTGSQDTKSGTDSSTSRSGAGTDGKKD